MNNANKKIALISDYFNLYLIILFIFFIKPKLFSDYQKLSYKLDQLKDDDKIVGITKINCNTLALATEKGEVFIQIID